MRTIRRERVLVSFLVVVLALAGALWLSAQRGPITLGGPVGSNFPHASGGPPMPAVPSNESLTPVP